MPVVVAFFARQLVIIGVQLGIYALIDKYITPQLNNAIRAIMTTFGVSENVAQDILANEVLTTAESLGLTVALSRAKLPLVISDKLGFSSRGYTKRKLPAKVEEQAKTLKRSTSGALATVAEGMSLELIGVAKATGFPQSLVSSAVSTIAKFVGTSSLALLAIAQWIDFGNWNSGAYQGTFNRLYSKFGLKPDENYSGPRVASEDMFNKVFTAMQNEGITQIRHPDTGEVLQFTQQNAVTVIDKLASKLFITEGKVGAKELLALTLALTTLKSSGSTVAVVSTPTVAAAPVQTPTVRVFTGVVSQGVVGGGVQFTERRDDLIEDAREMREAAFNNLAGFVASLSSLVRYEIKIQTNITTKDGFIQRGAAQQVVSGTNKDGTPKYRTVVNRFAVVNVYILNEKGGRTKLRQIVLGPVDAVRFSPSVSELAGIEKYIQENLVTSRTDSVQQIITQNGVQNGDSVETIISSQETSGKMAPQKLVNPNVEGIYTDKDKYLGEIYRNVGNEVWVFSPYQELFSETEKQELAPRSDKFSLIPQRLRDVGIEPGVFGTVPFIADVKNDAQKRDAYKSKGTQEFFYPLTPAPTVAATASPVCTAATLSEFYTARGTQLPPVSERAEIYASLNLGQSSYYTGTTEQNVKLLAALKTQLGCK